MARLPLVQVNVFHRKDLIVEPLNVDEIIQWIFLAADRQGHEKFQIFGVGEFSYWGVPFVPSLIQNSKSENTYFRMEGFSRMDKTIVFNLYAVE